MRFPDIIEDRIAEYQEDREGKISVARIYKVVEGSALAEDMTNVAPANGGAISVEAVTDFDPPTEGETAYVVIGSERITFTAIDEATDELLNITRGVDGTVAAAHASGTFVQNGLSVSTEKLADGFIDDDDSLSIGVEIRRHLWKSYPVGDRDFADMEVATVRFRDDGHPYIVDAPEDRDRSADIQWFKWSMTGDIELGVRPHRDKAPFTGTIEVAYVTMGNGGEPNGDDAIFEVLKGGATIITLTVPDGEFSSDRELPNVDITFGNILEFEVTQIGSTDPGSNPVITLGIRPKD